MAPVGTSSATASKRKRSKTSRRKGRLVKRSHPGRKQKTSSRKLSRISSKDDLNSQLILLKSQKTDKRTKKDSFKHLKNWVTSNPTSATNEISFKYRDFYDSNDVGGEHVSGQYLLDLKNLPGFSQAAIDQRPVAKVESVSLHAIPKFSMDSQSSSVMIISGLPVSTSTTTNDEAAPTPWALYAAQQATLVTPTASPDWVRVGGWSANKTLGEANLMLTANDKGLVPLMEWQILDPDTMTISTQKVQMMIEYIVSVAVPMVSVVRMRLNQGPEGNAWTGPLDGEASSTPVVLQPLRVTNVV